MAGEQARPRVLFVDHTAALGGAELCLIDVVAHADPSSSVVLFASGPLHDRFLLSGTDVEILPAPAAVLDVRRDGRSSTVRVAAGVLRLARRLARRARGYDLLYANSQKSLVVSAIAGALARRPVLWHLHDLLTDEHFGRAQRRVVVALARRLAARVVANSEATRDAYVAAGGRPETVDVIYNEIDPAPFDALADSSVTRARDILGLDAGPVLGMFGRLAPWKGHAVFLEALAGLPRAQALVVGDATFESDRAHAEALRSRAEVLGVSDRVRWLGFREDVPALMRACDVIVHASTSAEPFGRVIVEGMLAGRPVVAARAGGAMELVDDEATGLLVPPGDAAALRSALGRLIDDPALGSRLARAGAAAARERFAPARIGRMLQRSMRAARRPPREGREENNGGLGRSLKD